MTDNLGFVSPYLERPIRSLEEVRQERGEVTEESARTYRSRIADLVAFFRPGC